LATALTHLPPFRDLRHELTAVVVRVGDWESTLRDAQERVRKCWDAALVVTSGGAPMLLTGNGHIALGTTDRDDLFDAMTCFRYLLVDGRMFGDLCEAIPVIARIAQIHGCQVVLLVPVGELSEIVEALDSRPPASATRH